MSTKTIYTCDRCGRELEEHYDYIDVTIDLDCGCIHKCDLCGDCYHDLGETIESFLNNKITPKCSCDNSKDSSCCDCSKNSEIKIECNCYDNGRCNGTKERDECSCNGNEFECSFYDYVKVRAAEYYYTNLSADYKCPYWSTCKERRLNGAQYEVCRNSVGNDIVKCHGDKRLCQFPGIKQDASKFSNKVKEFLDDN